MPVLMTFMRRPVQLAADVVHHFLGGGGGQRQHRRTAQGLDRAGHLEVGRAEVVPPLRDAVGFVDHHQGDLHFLQHLDELRQARRSGVQNTISQRFSAMAASAARSSSATGCC
jgi:hypothetical protein